MENYKVGQVLYMTSVKSLNIIPVQVVEEVIRTSLSGKEKTYMIMLPDEEKTTLDIKSVKGLLFETKKAVKHYMMKNTETAIDKIIENAYKLQSVHFKATKSQTPSH